MASQKQQKAVAIKPQGDPSLSDLVDFLNPSKSASAAAKIDAMDPSAPRLAGVCVCVCVCVCVSVYTHTHTHAHTHTHTHAHT